MSYDIQMKRGTASSWTTNNPILAQGELGYETDTNRVKFGDGATAWTGLEYFDGNSAVFPIWAEENAGLNDGAYEWAYGNGDDTVNGSGIVIPFACECFALAMDHATAGSATVGLDNNGVATGASITTVTERNAYTTLGTPISFSAGDVANFHTITGTGSDSGNRVVAWFRANVSTVIGANEVTVRKNTGTDIGSRHRLNFIEGTNITFDIVDNDTDDEIIITINADGVVGPTSSTDNAIVRYDGITGKLIQDSTATIDDNGNIELNNKDVNTLKNGIFNSEIDAGNSGSAITVNFNTGQKQKLTLNSATVALTCTFPGVGNYILKLIQDASTPATAMTLATTGGSSLLPAGDLSVKDTAGSVTILTIYFDGTDAVYASIPDVKTGSVSIG